MNENALRKWFLVHFDYNPITGLFTNRVSGIAVSRKHPKGYIVLKGPKKKNYFAHRVAYLVMEGSWPNQIDHRNRVRDDNRWENLLNADQFLNAQNHGLRKTNKAGRTGVSYTKRYGWCAEMTRYGRRIRKRGLGSIEEATEWRERFEAMADKGEWESWSHCQ
jgi:hypothetical protein